jgi:hypothetical protein
LLHLLLLLLWPCELLCHHLLSQQQQQPLDMENPAG